MRAISRRHISVFLGVFVPVLAVSFGFGAWMLLTPSRRVPPPQAAAASRSPDPDLKALLDTARALAPLSYLLLGAHPVKADVVTVIAYILPHMG